MLKIQHVERIAPVRSWGAALTVRLVTLCRLFLRNSDVRVSSSLAILLALALLGGCRTGDADAAREAEPLLVLAASDLQFALPEIVREFEVETGVTSRVVFGSTGMLTAQLEQGAPGDLFLAANESFVDRLERGGLAMAGTRAAYAVGRLAIVTSPGRSPIRELSALADPSITLAIANPEHAPYGQAAREALEASGLWTASQGRIVMGENVGQALQFVRSGNADAGIVALGIVIGLAEAEYLLVDADLHQPLRQAGVVMRDSFQAASAHRLLAFIIGERGQRVLRGYGFEDPGE